MDENEWNNRFDRLLNSCLDAISESREQSTPADTGLVLYVLSDYFDDDEDTTERDARTLEIAAKILEYKHSTSNLPWFDVYCCVIMSPHMDATLQGKNDQSKTHDDAETEHIRKRIREQEKTRTHTAEFAETTTRLLEALTSEEAETIRETNPYLATEDDEYDWFSHKLQSRSGFVAGAVEIPNNASRMKAVDIIREMTDGLSERDFSWMIFQLRNWVEAYARAEAMIAHQNISHSDLRTFMMNHETPAEKFWS